MAQQLQSGVADAAPAFPRRKSTEKQTKIAIPAVSDFNSPQSMTKRVRKKMDIKDLSN